MLDVACRGTRSGEMSYKGYVNFTTELRIRTQGARIRTIALPQHVSIAPGG